MPNPTVILRQGDILIKSLSALPKNAEPVIERIVARGEVTGHYHEVQGDAKLYQSNSQLLIEVVSSAELVHQEHKSITIPVGIWSVNRQREYDPVTERLVRD